MFTLSLPHTSVHTLICQSQVKDVGESKGHRMQCDEAGRILFPWTASVHFHEMMQCVGGKFNGLHLSHSQQVVRVALYDSHSLEYINECHTVYSLPGMVKSLVCHENTAGCYVHGFIFVENRVIAANLHLVFWPHCIYTKNDAPSVESVERGLWGKAHFVAKCTLKLGIVSELSAVWFSLSFIGYYIPSHSPLLSFRERQDFLHTNFTKTIFLILSYSYSYFFQSICHFDLDEQKRHLRLCFSLCHVPNFYNL